MRNGPSAKLRLAVATIAVAAVTILACPAGAENWAIKRVDQNTIVLKGVAPGSSLFNFDNTKGVFQDKQAGTTVIRSSPAIIENRLRLLSQPSQPRGLIVGGSTQAHLGDYPWQVALVERAALDPENGQFCGGVLIDARHVITAAHCVWSATTRDFTIPHASIGVVAGATALKPGVPLLEVRNIIVHESWQRGDAMVRFDNDIALLELTNPISFTDYVKPAILATPTEGQLWSDKMGLRVVGWGNTSTTVLRSKSRDLLWVDVQVIGNSECSHIAGYNLLTDNMFCANLEGNGACAGDSGGGIISRDVFPAAVVGLVSWTRPLVVQGWQIGCTTADAPGVYTKLANYRNWISSHMTSTVAQNN